MISLSTRPDVPPTVVTLPSYCMPTRESDALVAKREAQLQWMRENGLHYLGDPQRLVRHEPQPRRRRSVSPVRLVRHHGAEPEAESTAEALESRA
ncbi:MAG: hypothetical protein JXB36_03835 [Gammaproteobacteria bacterium]|nr:hypothetical protein [Gammaproteobacteria bacterium]